MKKNIILVWTMAAVLPAIAASETEKVAESVAVADTSRVVDLDEVTVVSQPKEQFRLRQQPLSSSVFSSKEIEQQGLRDLRQLSVYVPSFAMPQYGARLTSSMYMRGIGNRMSGTAVGVYYDHIPLLSSGTFNHHFYMIDRVDVLRGPQGTLYGANTEGGIVRIYSKDPMRYQGTDVHLGEGSGFWRNAEVAHFHRPTDQLAFSVAGFYHGQDGFFSNENLHEMNDKTNEAGAKLRLMWKPTTKLTFDATADYQFTDQNGFPYGLYDVESQWPALPSTTIMPGYRRNMVSAGLNAGYDLGKLQLTSTTSYQHLYDKMQQDVDYLPKDAVVLAQRQKMNAVTEELVLRSKGTGIWQHATGLYGFRQWLTTKADVTFGSAITDTIASAIEQAMRSSMIRGMAAGMKNQFVAQGMPEAAAEAAALRAATAAVDAMGVHMSAEMPLVPSVFEQPVTNLAAYHESNLTLADRLTLTLGLRLDYTNYKLDYQSSGSASVTGGTNTAESTGTVISSIHDKLSSHSTQLLPKFGVTYKLKDDGSNVYATATKGYMAGGYNINLFGDIMRADLQKETTTNGVLERQHSEADYADIAKTITYDPEKSWNFELGTHLNLLSGKLHADFSAFYNLLTDQQLTVMAPGTGYGRMTINAERSSTCGLEAALRSVALDGHLTWAATYSFTRATFRKFINEEMVGGQLVSVDYKDKKIPNIPAHMFSALADYRFDVSRDQLLRSVTVGLQAAGNGKTYWDNANTAAQDFYATLGAHVLLDLGSFNVNFWGRNLTDTKYTTFALYNDSSDNFIGQRGLPLQLGIDVRLHL